MNKLTRRVVKMSIISSSLQGFGRTFLYALLPICVIMPLFVSCSSNDAFNFKSADDALTVYQSYLETVKQLKTTNTASFYKEINLWKETSDTIFHYLMKDSVFLKDEHCSDRFHAIHDSIRFEFLRLTETWRYSYNDVLKIKEQTSAFHEDRELQEAVREAQPFFLALDSIALADDNKASILLRYRQLLKETKVSSISNKSDMLDFIGKEDIMFRSFLRHLYEMDNEPLADITQETEAICRNIFIAAKDGKIPARDAMVYMSMRTVRRLLQNSTACIADINHQQMKSKAQGNAYLWMIIQPFISIDQFSIATLTPQEHSQFNYIISQLPKSTKFAKTFDIDPKGIELSASTAVVEDVYTHTIIILYDYDSRRSYQIHGIGTADAAPNRRE
ncbi:hypothetical protein O3689_02455 [Prevotella nigrescens]|uniref:hypothetical protein n=1 Tax=Prevotella nigrescens TaxID=28133 RepID=UPI00352EB77C